MNTKTASNNNWLTQVALNSGEQRLFVKEVAGFGNLEERFTEWTDEQKEQWEQEHPQEENEDISAEEALNIITGKE